MCWSVMANCISEVSLSGLMLTVASAIGDLPAVSATIPFIEPLTLAGEADVGLAEPSVFTWDTACSR